MTGHIRGCIQSNPNKKLERKMTSTILIPELPPINPTQAIALETPPKSHPEGTMACQFSSWILSFLNQRVLLPLFLVVSVRRNWPSYKTQCLGKLAVDFQIQTSGKDDLGVILKSYFGPSGYCPSSRHGRVNEAYPAKQVTEQ